MYVHCIFLLQHGTVQQRPPHIALSHIHKLLSLQLLPFHLIIPSLHHPRPPITLSLPNTLQHALNRQLLPLIPLAHNLRTKSIRLETQPPLQHAPIPNHPLNERLRNLHIRPFRRTANMPIRLSCRKLRALQLQLRKRLSMALLAHHARYIAERWLLNLHGYEA